METENRPFLKEWLKMVKLTAPPTLDLQIDGIDKEILNNSNANLRGRRNTMVSSMLDDPFDGVHRFNFSDRCIPKTLTPQIGPHSHDTEREKHLALEVEALNIENQSLKKLLRQLQQNTDLPSSPPKVSPKRQPKGTIKLGKLGVEPGVLLGNEGEEKETAQPGRISITPSVSLQNIPEIDYLSMMTVQALAIEGMLDNVPHLGNRISFGAFPTQ
jgi:hypothetical protein